jgi:hypothetical protein
MDRLALIRVEAAEEHVTLVDPLGRVGSLNGEIYLSGIPGCNRFTGGSLLVPAGEGEPVPTTMFELSSPIMGEYVLRARAEADGLFFVQATLMVGAKPACDESDSQETHRGTMRTWAIEWEAEPGGDSCRVTIRRINAHGQPR